MKTIGQFIVIAFFIIITIHAKAQSRKVIYTENEMVLPNFLQFETGGIANAAIRGKIQDKIVYISWQTTTEINTSHFELQRSENGNIFEPIETITAGGITKSTNNYLTTDTKNNFYRNKIYYRLKIVFINGKEDCTDSIIVVINSIAGT